MSAIETAALAYYQARVNRAECKKVLLDFRQHRGGCEGGQTNYDFNHNEHHTPCYIIFMGEQDKWCDVCADSQPLYECQKRAAHEVGKALRRLVYLCQKHASQPEVK